MLLQYSRNYDPHHQPTEVLTVPVDLMPGDQLLTSCIYDTSDETQPVGWGQTAHDEMCFAYIYYYPALYSGGCFNYNGRYWPTSTHARLLCPLPACLPAWWLLLLTVVVVLMLQT